MHPDEFDIIIEEKVFASARADRSQVKRLYRKVWMDHLCFAEEIRRKWWTDVEAADFPRMLPHLPQLSKTLDLT